MGSVLGHVQSYLIFYVQTFVKIAKRFIQLIFGAQSTSIQACTTCTCTIVWMPEVWGM